MNTKALCDEFADRLDTHVSDARDALKNGHMTAAQESLKRAAQWMDALRIVLRHHLDATTQIVAK